jgi:hypothetical protein
MKKDYFDDVFRYEPDDGHLIMKGEIYYQVSDPRHSASSGFYFFQFPHSFNLIFQKTL